MTSARQAYYNKHKTLKKRRGLFGASASRPKRARKAHKNTRKENASASPRVLFRRMVSSLALAVSLTTCAFLVFVSPAMAAFGIGLVAACILGVGEITRRKKWESAFGSRLNRVETDQKNLAKRIMKHGSDIGSLRAETIKLSRNGVQAEERENVPDFMDLASIPEGILPRAEKPQRYGSVTFDPNGIAEEYMDLVPEGDEEEDVSNLAANDDPFAEHANLSKAVIQELVHQAIRNERIEVFMQPVVRLPQRQHTGYELFARIRAKPGLYVPAERYMSSARKDKLQCEIDILLLNEILNKIKEQASKDRLDKGTVFFINIEAATLKHKRYMNTLLNFVAKNRDLASSLVFEMAQREFEEMPDNILKILRGLGQLGCSFSIDHVETLSFSLTKYLESHIHYIKIKADDVLQRGESNYSFSHFRKQKRIMEKQGIRVIIERIETENSVRELLDFDLRYGQGYLFGKPDLQGAYRPFAYTRETAKRQGVRESFG